MSQSGTERSLVTVHQAARRLGLAPRRLRVAVRRGELPGYRPGDRTVYVRWPEVLSWLRTQRVPSSDHARIRAAEIISEEEQKETAAR
jgi:excisionase family DNA binding protein